MWNVSLIINWIACLSFLFGVCICIEKIACFISQDGRNAVILVQLLTRLLIRVLLRVKYKRNHYLLFQSLISTKRTQHHPLNYSKLCKDRCQYCSISGHLVKWPRIGRMNGKLLQCTGSWPMKFELVTANLLPVPQT